MDLVLNNIQRFICHYKQTNKQTNFLEKYHFPTFEILLHSHKQLYTYTCRNIVNTIMTSEHTSLEKYTSHTLFEMVAKGLRKVYEWQVSWRLNKLQHIDPSSSGYSSTSFSSCGAAQPGALRAQLSAGSGCHCFELQQLTSNQLNFLSHRVISLFAVHLLHVSVTFALNSTRPRSSCLCTLHLIQYGQGLPWYLRPNVPVLWLTAGSICYNLSLAITYHLNYCYLVSWHINLI